jgi:serine/threonine protein kinase/tetratricopeptide (TPR) repeat protein
LLKAFSRLGPYEIVSPVGAGGMGEVYRARDTRLGREVAVKVLHELFAQDPVRRERFEREARAVAALSHPNILAIHDYGTHEDVTYAVMELLEGETLRSRISRGPLPWRESVQIGAAIADGLAAAHAKGIVHRDLKPENLFLTTDGRVKILDFGLARVTPAPDSLSETSPYVSNETAVGTVMGTVGYMSPEQVRGQTANAPSDLFSFGCVLYEMLSGRRAFHRETAAETMTAILHDEPSEPVTTGEPVPAELGRILRQCLAKIPHDRLQSARDLALGLRALATDPGPHVLPIPRRRSRPVLAGIGGALFLIGVVGTSAYVLTRDGKPSDPERPADEAPAIDALAVLPFVYTAGDAKMELISQTLAGHISDSLRQVGRRELKIRPPSSVSRYTRQRPDTRTIGRELNVPLIVTGTLQPRGEELTITVEVVDAREDNLLWSKPYPTRNGETLNVDLQDRIVQDVAANLGLGLSDDEQRRLTRRRTVDPDAYNLYREAMYHLSKFTPDGIAAGIKAGTRAIEKDPKSPLGYVVVARCLVLRGSLYDGPKKTYRDVRKYVDEALRLDPNLPDAHAVMAVTHLFHDWDWQATERELKQAIALDSSVPLTWNFLGFTLAAQGRLPEALTSIRRGQELDPVAPGRRNELAMCFNWMGEHDKAIIEANKALELDPNFPLAHASIGIAYVKKKMYDEAIAEMGKVVNRGPLPPAVKGIIGYAYAKGGKRAEAQKVLDELTAQAPGRFAFALPIARIHAALGDYDAAFDWLRKSCDERDSQIVWVKVDPTLDDLRSDPRFTQILKDMGLPP